jgi:serine/arginine repetitive matrix protein 1
MASRCLLPRRQIGYANKILQPNIKELQIQLTGFLDKDAATFCQALWKLCLSAQDSQHGVPKELLEAKKAELAQAKVCLLYYISDIS